MVSKDNKEGELAQNIRSELVRIELHPIQYHQSINLPHPQITYLPNTSPTQQQPNENISSIPYIVENPPTHPWQPKPYVRPKPLPEQNDIEKEGWKCGRRTTTYKDIIQSILESNLSRNAIYGVCCKVHKCRRNQQAGAGIASEIIKWNWFVRKRSYDWFCSKRNESES